MKKKATYYLSAMLMVACFTQPASAQFEGKISYNSYEYSDNGTQEKQDEFSLYITPERLMLQGNNKYEFMGSIKTEGVLVRLDTQDFVFLTGKKQALKIAKSDITAMMNMVGNGQSSSKAVEKSDNINYERTGEAKTIKGYKVEKFIFRDQENKNNHTAVWMTKDINVNWGMLAEPWSGSADKIISSFPTDLVFKENYFPIQIDSFEGDSLVSKLEATEVSETSIAGQMVQVPSGVQVMSFQEYLFQKMNQ